MIFKSYKSQKSGFTLIEISIVLMIIGLLSAGILVGRELIKAAEMRAFIRGLDSIYLRVNMFKLKYGCEPGDCTNATTFFGKQNARCAFQDGGPADPGTCNGNGDGSLRGVDLGAGVSLSEGINFWQHLILAGEPFDFISFPMQQTSASQTMPSFTKIMRTPRSGIGFFTTYGGDTVGGGPVMNPTKLVLTTTNQGPSVAEIMLLETKYDDELAQTGIMKAIHWASYNDDPSSCIHYDPGPQTYTYALESTAESTACTIHIQLR